MAKKPGMSLRTQFLIMNLKSPEIGISDDTVSIEQKLGHIATLVVEMDQTVLGLYTEDYLTATDADGREWGYRIGRTATGDAGYVRHAIDSFEDPAELQITDRIPLSGLPLSLQRSIHPGGKAPVTAMVDIQVDAILFPGSPEEVALRQKDNQ